MAREALLVLPPSALLPAGFCWMNVLRISYRLPPTKRPSSGASRKNFIKKFLQHGCEGCPRVLVSGWGGEFAIAWVRTGLDEGPDSVAADGDLVAAAVEVDRDRPCHAPAHVPSRAFRAGT